MVKLFGAHILLEYSYCIDGYVSVELAVRVSCVLLCIFATTPMVSLYAFVFGLYAYIDCPALNPGATVKLVP